MAAQNHVIPEIKVTQTDSPSPDVIEENLLARAVSKLTSVTNNNELSYRKYSDPVVIPIAMQNGHIRYLKPESLLIEDSEKTPLLGFTAPSTPRQRRRSFGYQDKRFDDDAPKIVEVNRKSKWRQYLNYLKIAIVSSILVASVVTYAAEQEHSLTYKQYIASYDKRVVLNLTEHLQHRPMLRMTLRGRFVQNSVPSAHSGDFFITLQTTSCDLFTETNVVEEQLDILPEHLREEVPEAEVTFIFDLEPYATNSCNVQVLMSTDAESMPFSVQINELSSNFQYGVIYAACVLFGLYMLIIFEIVHRALAAMLAATVSISILSTMNEKPTVEEIMQWIDIETICLLFGMMVIVALICETGFFDYVAVLAYKLAKGSVWPLLTILCLTTAVISAFLDNVTTILLLTPITIRLSEVMNLNPKYVLIALVMFSNVGGTATAVGDPPNVIIVSNAEIQKSGIEFANFTMHLGLGIVFVLAATYGLIYVMYRTCIRLTLDDKPEVVEIKQEIQVWRRAAKNLSLYSRDESTVRKMLMEKVDVLENLLKKRMYNQRRTEEDYKASLLELEKNYKIHDWPLLIKSGIVLLAVIVMFFMHSLVPGMNISLGWIALMGAILLLLLADFSEVEQLLCWVEWSTLIFFAALFVVMEALASMGLLEYIGDATEQFILGVDEDKRLLVSLVLILWVSAIASSFIDNIPFTTVMLKIVLKMGKNPSLGLPLQPLVWALAFGACLGGNGTVIGASANVVCAGVAEQHGYRFSFWEFFKVGFPTTLVTTTVAMVYLIICHVVLEWNY